ncbi:receptor-like protein 12 [Hibiscus syriacus]|uniref:receptor-like protein 12 n=1 Tax=Hibiscus syriacus TaxID=106335 RepID=UPI001924B64E|nr:receptor-like protein 12 [Hibiscus syriacus]
MSGLSFLDASHNNLSGPIPNCLGNMSSLEYLDLHENNFSGILPDFEKAPNLWVLNVRKNKLEGKLPRSLAECTPLQVLDVGNNMLRDTFPFWLEKLPALKVLILRENRFYGEIKNFKHKIVFPTLDVLDIASNEFSGELSVDFFQASQLRSLKISGNKFEGKLPRSLATCSKLEVLDLGNNMVHDTFPIWLMKSPSLKVLILRENRFHGTIEDLDIGHDFQTCEYWTLLPTIFLYNGGEYYEDSVTIVNKGVELFYEKVLTILTCLDLSNNSFHGRIPEDIHILRSLKVLNLSHNSFSGEIPSALDNLKELESLDLSMNNLSGKIPPQLTGLTFLAAFNLSYNQLEGSIPQATNSLHFQTALTLGIQSYVGRHCRGNAMMLVFQCHHLLQGKMKRIHGICIGFTVLNEYGNKWVYKFQKIQSLRNDSVRALSLVWINSGGNDFHALVMFRMVLLRREQAMPVGWSLGYALDIQF